MPYGYIASMKTQPGKRDDVVAILLSGLDGLKAAGASQYTVAVDAADDVTIWVRSIAKAMPMLTGEFTGVETDVCGAL